MYHDIPKITKSDQTHTTKQLQYFNASDFICSLLLDYSTQRLPYIYPAVLEVIPGKYTIHTEHLGYVCRSTESKFQVNGWYATGSCETTETCRGIKCRVPGTQAGWSGEGSKIVRYNRTMAMEREREDGTMMFNDLFPLINNKHPPETMF